MQEFDHAKLDGSQAAIDLVVMADDVAEGAGEFSRQEKARFYRMARLGHRVCGNL